MEIIINILIKAFNFAVIIIAIVFTLAMLRAALMTLKNQLSKVNRAKVSVENSHHEILLLNTSEYESLNELIHNLAHEFREFSDKVNYYDRTPETIHDIKAKENFKQLCYGISDQIKIPKRIPLDSNLYQNLDKTIDFLRRSAYSKEPIAKVFLECKFHLPIGEPLSVKLWDDEVKEEYWREKYYFVSLKKGTTSWLGIELTYTKELLEAPITSKKFKEFLENKIKNLNSDLRQTQKILEVRKIVNDSQKNSSYGLDNVSQLHQLNYMDMTTKTVLFLAANPKQTVRLRLDEELREIDEGLRRANKRQQFKLEPKGAVRLRDFYRAILDSSPQIIHFSGHGEGQEGIILEDETGHPLFVEAIQLAGWFEVLAGEGVECVLLNACYSKEQAEAICQYVPYVIGMNQSITDKAAIDFAVGFYDALGSGRDVEFAFKLGRSQLVRLGEHEIPILLKKEMTA